MEPHDVPPPPYSETDIYASSSVDNQSNAASTRPHLSQADDASSSRSNIIYTPPDTPQDSHHAFTGAEDCQTTASAQVYFDTRSATDHLMASAPIVHTISVSDDPSPVDFPYPSWAASRDVNQQDWRTFINYLIPDYADKANIGIMDRKLRSSETGSPTPSTPAAAREAAPEPQLDELKSSSVRRRLTNTVKEWNGGFFGPRAVSIRLLEETSTSEPKARMPSDAGSAERGLGVASSSPAAPQGRGGWREQLAQRLGMDINERGLRMGPLTIDGDRVAFGSTLEMDSRGVRWNGRDIAEQWSGGDRHHAAGMSRGRGTGRWWQHDGIGHPARRGGGGGGGGGPFDHNTYGHARRRSQSRSSQSSDSSSSSSDSNSTMSSIGSLPDWDDLRDSQIPVVKQSVEAWLARPDHIVTKAELKRAKSEIKAAKSLPQPAVASDARQREEIKNLLSRFSDLKKHQATSVKKARREARAQKRAERRSKKARNRGEKKEQRRHRREHRRAERELGRQQRRQGKTPEVPLRDQQARPQQPPAPPIPPFIPGAHPVSPFPMAPDHPFGPGRSAGGSPGFSLSGGGGGGWGRGYHHQWPPHQHQHHHHQHAATAESSRAQAEAAREQAFEARVRAHEQAVQARAHAHEMAVHQRAMAHEQAARARAQAAVQRDLAHSQAAAAVASATRQQIQTQTQSQAQAQQERYAAKYRAAQALEQEMEAKRVALRSLQESAEAEAIAAAKAGRGDEKRAGGPSQTESNAEALEREIEDLGCRIEELIFEADEEFAKTLEQEDGRDEKSKVRWLE